MISSQRRNPALSAPTLLDCIKSTTIFVLPLYAGAMCVWSKNETCSWIRTTCTYWPNAYEDSDPTDKLFSLILNQIMTHINIRKYFVCFGAIYSSSAVIFVWCIHRFSGDVDDNNVWVFVSTVRGHISRPFKCHVLDLVRHFSWKLKSRYQPANILEEVRYGQTNKCIAYAPYKCRNSWIPFSKFKKLSFIPLNMNLWL